MITCFSFHQEIKIEAYIIFFFFWLQIMFEDGVTEFLDMSKENWEFVTL